MITQFKKARQGSRFARVSRLALLAGMLTALAVPVGMSAPVRADEPLRSGTILSGASETPINPWVRGMEGCVGAAMCSAWLQSGCAPALAGADPASQAAIVDVADLADGVTTRYLSVTDAVVQFWTTDDTWDAVDEPVGLDGERCWELAAHRLTPYEPCARSFSGNGCAFHIPEDAKFMTITSRLDWAILEWTLS